MEVGKAAAEEAGSMPVKTIKRCQSDRDWWFAVIGKAIMGGEA